jgi:type II secretory pathway pseudopilin PulG
MMRPSSVFSAILCTLACAGAAAPILAAPTGFAILDDARAFRGRITYVAHRTDTMPAPRIAGTLSIGNARWAVEERSTSAVASAGSDGGTLQGGGLNTGVDDPLAAGSIVNAWALAMGTLSQVPPAHTPATDADWQSANIRLYLNDTRDAVQGLADTAGAGDVTFALDDWIDVDGIRLPSHVMRLRDGAPEATYLVEEYTVLRAPVLAAIASLPRAKTISDAAGGNGILAPQPPVEFQHRDFPWRLVSSAFGLLLLGVMVVAWTRRDAFVEMLRTRVQVDPRGWKARGVSVFVTSDGRMWFDGAEYLIDPQFYGRRAIVQSSPLFLRIGAREVPRAVIVARKFRVPALRIAMIERSRSTGFSLIENIVAIGLFSMVIVGAVYPTLAVMANGDRIARTQSDAVRLAANALNDEEIASAYGAVNVGTMKTQNGALTLVVTVEVSKSGVAGAFDIDVAVLEPGGRTLAHAISTVGPPVQAPPPPGHTPNPSPAPSG